MVVAFRLAQAGIAALPRRLEHHDPKRNMDLGGGQAGPVGIDHGLDHVTDQTPYFRGPGIGDGGGNLAQNGMAHAGDLEDHGRKYGDFEGPGQSPEALIPARWTGQKPSVINPAFPNGAFLCRSSSATTISTRPSRR